MRWSLRILGTGSLRTKSASWRLKFPMAISPDLSTFVVLRTIFTPGGTSQRQDSSKNVFMNVPNLDRWSMRQPPQIRSASLPLPYVYEWAFSSDGSYCIFRDWNMESFRGSLTVLCLNRNETGIASHVAGYYEFSGGTGLRLCALHPNQSKIAVLDKDKLMFRDLKSGMSLSFTVQYIYLF